MRWQRRAGGRQEDRQAGVGVWSLEAGPGSVEEKRGYQRGKEWIRKKYSEAAVLFGKTYSVPDLRYYRQSPLPG